MHRQHTQAYYTREQLFNDRFPLAIVAVLAIIQMLTNFAIIALEIVRILISIRLTNLFAGFWTSLPFTILWISMFATVCCCRRRSCATHAVIQNLLSFLFAAALIGINIAFLRQPDRCFFTTEICEKISWNHEIDLPFNCFTWADNHCESVRLTLIKAQLAAAALMATTCLIYLMLYCIVASRADRRPIPAAADAVMAPVYPTPITSTVNYQHQPYTHSPHLHHPSAPAMIPAYPQVSLGNPNATFAPAIYPTIPNDRF